ncbi:sigma factor-like helix-turn-helix DNA-binding protein [Nocardia altamirensis]|uniref:sigma factor-like helix-turn-helix DNA-binding protein n=1 Tax=Nocardia altamirensis TaxID=472158 RepID=UPI00084076DE|nr:sigma factor-like helix-turn-helix DNA-binding protein [Nocardia altamirensis]
MSPSVVDFAEAAVFGGEFPKGDPTALRRLAAAWRAQAADCVGVQSAVANLVHRLQGSVHQSSDFGTAAVESGRQVSAGSAELSTYCTAVADWLDGLANDVEKAQQEMLLMLLTVLAVGANAASVLRAQAQFVTLLEGLISRIGIQSAAMASARAGLVAIEGLVFGSVQAGVDLGLQAVQPTRRTIDWTSVVAAGMSGAGSAVAGSAGGLLAERLLVDRALPGWRRTVLVGGTAGVFGAFGATAGVSAVTGQFDVTPMHIVSGALLGSAAHAIATSRAADTTSPATERIDSLGVEQLSADAEPNVVLDRLSRSNEIAALDELRSLAQATDPVVEFIGPGSRIRPAGGESGGDGHGGGFATEDGGGAPQPWWPGGVYGDGGMTAPGRAGLVPAGGSGGEARFVPDRGGFGSFVRGGDGSVDLGPGRIPGSLTAQEGVIFDGSIGKPITANARQAVLEQAPDIGDWRPPGADPTGNPAAEFARMAEAEALSQLAELSSAPRPTAETAGPRPAETAGLAEPGGRSVNETPSTFGELPTPPSENALPEPIPSAHRAGPEPNSVPDPAPGTSPHGPEPIPSAHRSGHGPNSVPDPSPHGTAGAAEPAWSAPAQPGGPVIPDAHRPDAPKPPTPPTLDPTDPNPHVIIAPTEISDPSKIDRTPPPIGDPPTVSPSMPYPSVDEPLMAAEGTPPPHPEDDGPDDAASNADGTASSADNVGGSAADDARTGEPGAADAPPLDNLQAIRADVFAELSQARTVLDNFGPAFGIDPNQPLSQADRSQLQDALGDLRDDLRALGFTAEDMADVARAVEKRDAVIADATELDPTAVVREFVLAHAVADSLDTAEALAALVVQIDSFVQAVTRMVTLRTRAERLLADRSRHLERLGNPNPDEVKRQYVATRARLLELLPAGDTSLRIADIAQHPERYPLAVVELAEHLRELGEDVRAADILADCDDHLSDVRVDAHEVDAIAIDLRRRSTWLTNLTAEIRNQTTRLGFGDIRPDTVGHLNVERALAQAQADAAALGGPPDARIRDLRRLSEALRYWKELRAQQTEAYRFLRNAIGTPVPMIGDSIGTTLTEHARAARAQIPLWRSAIARSLAAEGSSIEVDQVLPSSSPTRVRWADRLADARERLAEQLTAAGLVELFPEDLEDPLRIAEATRRIEASRPDAALDGALGAFTIAFAAMHAVEEHDRFVTRVTVLVLLDRARAQLRGEFDRAVDGHAEIGDRLLWVAALVRGLERHAAQIDTLASAPILPGTDPDFIDWISAQYDIPHEELRPGLPTQERLDQRSAEVRTRLAALLGVDPHTIATELTNSLLADEVPELPPADRLALPNPFTVSSLLDAVQGTGQVDEATWQRTRDLLLPKVAAEFEVLRTLTEWGAAHYRRDLELARANHEFDVELADVMHEITGERPRFVDPGAAQRSERIGHHLDELYRQVTAQAFHYVDTNRITPAHAMAPDSAELRQVDDLLEQTRERVARHKSVDIASVTRSQVEIWLHAAGRAESDDPDRIDTLALCADLYRAKDLATSFHRASAWARAIDATDRALEQAGRWREREMRWRQGLDWQRTFTELDSLARTLDELAERHNRRVADHQSMTALFSRSLRAIDLHRLPKFADSASYEEPLRVQRAGECEGLASALTETDLQHGVVDPAALTESWVRAIVDQLSRIDDAMLLPADYAALRHARRIETIDSLLSLVDRLSAAERDIDELTGKLDAGFTEVATRGVAAFQRHSAADIPGTCWVAAVDFAMQGRGRRPQIDVPDEIRTGSALRGIEAGDGSRWARANIRGFHDAVAAFDEVRRFGKTVVLVTDYSPIHSSLGADAATIKRDDDGQVVVGQQLPLTGPDGTLLRGPDGKVLVYTEITRGEAAVREWAARLTAESGAVTFHGWVFNSDGTPEDPVASEPDNILGHQLPRGRIHGRPTDDRTVTDAERLNQLLTRTDTLTSEESTTVFRAALLIHPDVMTRCLAALSAFERRSVEMRHLQGHSVAEIAATVGKSAVSVNNARLKGAQKLVTLLRRELAPPSMSELLARAESLTYDEATRVVTDGFVTYPQEMTRGLLRLTNLEREYLKLRFQDGRSRDEIASANDKSVPSVTKAEQLGVWQMVKWLAAEVDQPSPLALLEHSGPFARGEREFMIRDAMAVAPDAVHRCLIELTTDQQRWFELRFQQEHSRTAIAQLLGKAEWSRRNLEDATETRLISLLTTMFRPDSVRPPTRLAEHLADADTTDRRDATAAIVKAAAEHPETMQCYLAQLTERQRRSIDLQVFQDLSNQQAAAILGVDVPAARIMLSRIVRRLAGWLVTDLGPPTVLVPLESATVVDNDAASLPGAGQPTEARDPRPMDSRDPVAADAAKPIISSGEFRFRRWFRTRENRQEAGLPTQGLAQYANMRFLSEEQVRRWLAGIDADPDRLVTESETPVPHPRHFDHRHHWMVALRYYLALCVDQMDEIIDAPQGTWRAVESGDQWLTTGQLRALLRRIPDARQHYGAVALRFHPELAIAGVAHYPEGYPHIGAYLKYRRDGRENHAAEALRLSREHIRNVEAERREPSRKIVEFYLNEFPGTATYAEVAECSTELPAPVLRFPDVRDVKSLHEYQHYFGQANNLPHTAVVQLFYHGERRRGVSDDLRVLEIYDRFLHEAAPWHILAESWGYTYRMDPAGEKAPDAAQFTTLNDWLKAVRLWRRMTQQEFGSATGNSVSWATSVEKFALRPTLTALRSIRDAGIISNEILRAAIERFLQHPTEPELAARYWEFVETRALSLEENSARYQIYRRFAGNTSGEPTEHSRQRLDAFLQDGSRRRPDPTDPNLVFPHPSEARSLNEYLQNFMRGNSLSYRTVSGMFGIQFDLTRISTSPEPLALQVYDRLLHRAGPWNDIAAAWGYSHRMDPAGETRPAPAEFEFVNEWLRAMQLHHRVTMTEFESAAGHPKGRVTVTGPNRHRPSLINLRRLRDAGFITADDLEAAAICFYSDPDAPVAQPKEQEEARSIIDARVGSEEEEAALNIFLLRFDHISRAAARRWVYDRTRQDNIEQISRIRFVRAMRSHIPSRAFAPIAWGICRNVAFEDYLEVKFPHLSRADRRFVQPVDKYIAANYQEGRGEPHDIEIAQALGLTVADVTLAQELMARRSVSTDLPVFDGPSSVSVASNISDPDRPQENVILQNTIRTSLADLPDADVAVELVELCFIEGALVTEAAAQLQIPLERAQELLDLAAERLRAAYGELE